jgi:ADP-heptose:LPS heptosyltransferase
LNLLSAIAIGISRKYPGNRPVDITKVVRKPGKVLCFPAQGDGELLCAIPAIRALRKHYRDSLIALLIDEDKRGLWHFDNEVDEVIDFRPKLLKGVGSKEYNRLKKIFKHRKFDLLLDLNYRNDQIASYLFFRTGVPVRYGQDTGNDYPFKNFLVKPSMLSSDEINRNLNMLSPLGAHMGSHHAAWPKLVGLEGKREFKERLKEEGLKKGQIVLALDGSHWKRRSLEKALALLSRDQNVKLIVINPDPSINPQMLSGQIVMQSPSAAETAEALSQAQAYVGSKSDLFSIAYMLKIPGLITVLPGSKGLPQQGELLQIRQGKIPFEIDEEELKKYLQKIF